MNAVFIIAYENRSTVFAKLKSKILKNLSVSMNRSQKRIYVKLFIKAANFKILRLFFAQKAFHIWAIRSAEIFAHWIKNSKSKSKICSCRFIVKLSRFRPLFCSAHIVNSDLSQEVQGLVMQIVFLYLFSLAFSMCVMLVMYSYYFLCFLAKTHCGSAISFVYLPVIVSSTVQPV